MRYLFGLLLVLILAVASGTAAFAGECEYKPYTRDDNVVGTMVVNEFNVYCGYAVKQKNGTRLFIDNEGRYEHFSTDYAFEDILSYLCSKCAYDVPGSEDNGN